MVDMTFLSGQEQSLACCLLVAVFQAPTHGPCGHGQRYCVHLPFCESTLALSSVTSRCSEVLLRRSGGLVFTAAVTAGVGRTHTHTHSHTHSNGVGPGSISFGINAWSVSTERDLIRLQCTFGTVGGMLQDALLVDSKK